MANYRVILEDILVVCLVSLFCWINFASSEVYERDFSDVDTFKVIGINHHALYRSRAVKSINDYLVDSTKSADPDTNLNILLEQLILDFKNGIKYDDEYIQAKRLILSLRSLNNDDEYRCSYYYQRVLVKCLFAFGTEIESIKTKNTEEMTRIDRILSHYIDEHVKNCAQFYIKRYDEIRANSDQVQLLKLLDSLTEQAIRGLAAPGKNYENDLEQVAVSNVGRLFRMSPKYTYNRMKYLAEDDPKVSNLNPIRDRKTGILHINRTVFYKVFSEYVARPCVYFRLTFGPDVFEPLLFDTMFNHPIQKGRIDFYEALLKYRLCMMDPIREELNEIINFVEKQANDINVE